MTAPRILIATGGTAGHVVPALAVADALRANGADVHFVGSDRAEAELVPAAGYELHRLNVVSLPRRSPVGAAKAVAVDTAAIALATALVARLRPRAVFGGGGYVAGPVGLAAAMLRIPLVIAEIDGHLGLTNRMLAPLARRVCTALPLPGHTSSKFVITGRPIPAIPSDRQAARARFAVGPEETLVLVFGGSQGARSINQAAIEAFAHSSFRVLHAAGERDLPSLLAPRPGYDLRGYISGLMDAIVASDLAVSRSGGSIWELAAAGRPSVLIPYPYATADHQTLNARYLADAGAAVVIPDAELDHERLRTEVDVLLANPARLEDMERAALGLARPHAAAVIASEVLAAAGVKSVIAGNHAGELEA
ncbi:MAG TPA: UDP-N-acetylglucosamine--N-acetylmuramyl-(pentapeptide) pyrophosphoryl-undecaprenol N-acetylglucosamine transferase [Solirubrobacteraceae bacterium]|jgi:UDP-N-acetylglucosamine--N-acetylmuramyl-(pentapeptide) pyrophosphoryl-undecaprenol N-acetylglucosamine transferase|nr:UDP-N-acetylglucosamine--N-acetylmuramyl-(pentapeptide) pyrophosphoryl-undecaprenol N-acetylglucosamine transferase [Solirubrobacteraceae bacterium]